jgi:hypothetical protein
MPTPKEPKRQTSLDTLEDYVAARVRRILAAMQARGYDAVAYEAARTEERQRWLYGVGRTHSLTRKPVTWTLHSLHIPRNGGKGKAVDIISKSRGWNWPEFYDALAEEAKKEGMHPIDVERCHIQWG